MKDSESGSAALAFVDFLLLTLVTVLVIQSRAVELHAIDFEPPTVSGQGVDPIREPVELVLDFDAHGALSRAGRSTTFEAVEDELTATPSRVLLRAATELDAGALVDCVSRLRAVADSVQLQVTPQRSRK